jgi:hypothetical protein
MPDHAACGVRGIGVAVFDEHTFAIADVGDTLEKILILCSSESSCKENKYRGDAQIQEVSCAFGTVIRAGEIHR